MLRLPGQVLAVFAVLSAATAFAQTYPTRNITMLVPFAAGGPTDTVARTLGQSMTRPLGQTVTIENRPSAGGILAPEQVARANPDGYTILIHHVGMATIPALYRAPRFNTIEDFEPVGLVNEVPMTIIARPDFPATRFADFIAYIKANREKINYANAGIGAASHLCGMLFMSAIQTDLTTVPFSGTAPAMTALLGSQVDFMCDQTTSTTGQIKAGKVKAFGITSRQRNAALPDLATLDEQGLKGFAVGIWHGLYAPKKTPAAVVEKLSAALQESLRDESVRKRFTDLGAETYGPERGTPAALRAHLKAEIDRWGPLIKKAGVYAD